MPPLRSAPPSISVVIPVWNDADALSDALRCLLREWPIDALWVVDGGSADRSVEVARSHRVHLLQTPFPSRARQMNAGAELCGNDVILFLHADARLPSGAAGCIAQAVGKGAVGGAFARRFDRPSVFLRTTCRLADWRGIWFGRFFGDQAIFCTREAFMSVGGFPDQPQFEDLEFSRRLSRAGRTVLLRPPIVTSARRFEARGPVRQSFADLALTVRYLFTGP